MEQRGTSDDVLQQLSEGVKLALGERGVLAPDWLVLQVIERRVGPLDLTGGLGPAAMAALVGHVVDDLNGSTPDADRDALPMIFSLDQAGRLVAALGVVAHCASVNADRPPLQLAAVLGQAAGCLVAVGSAIRDTHRAGDAVLLLSGEVVDGARGAIAGALAQVMSGHWVTVGGESERASVVQVLQDGLARLVPA